MFENEFLNEFEGFSRSDIVGISLLSKDDLFRDARHFHCMNENVIDDSGSNGMILDKMNSIVNITYPEEIGTPSEEIDINDFEAATDEDSEELNLLDVEDIDDIETGEADDEYDLIDLVLDEVL